MTEHEIAFVKKCIRENIHRFYTWGKWKALREQVLKLDKYECQLCKKRGKYTKATTVHHVNYVKKHPDKALRSGETYSACAMIVMKRFMDIESQRKKNR